MNVFLTVALLIVANIAVAQSHDHHSGHGKQISNKTESKIKFTPTSDLKVRMEKILSLMKKLNPKKNDVKFVKSYGNKIAETVNDIFKTCKLDAESDAAIHPILATILLGSNEFKNGNFENGHKKIHEALLDYEKTFKHEGWKH